MNRPAPAPSGRAWLVWGVGLAVYVLAVFHRSSLAVAGLAASERFDISASQLATFAMLQLLVYAGMQIPVGLLVDRFGSRTVLTCGTVLLSLSQAGFALASSYPAALVARVFVGMGDAMTFICVLRLVSSWFPGRRVPLVSQLTGNIGQLGALGAAVPMTWALGHLGWTTAYLSAAVLGPVLLVVLRLVLHDHPEQRHVRGTPLNGQALLASLRASWAQPGTRLGFWVHFTTPFSATMLALLWGYPFFVKGEGVSPTTAGTLLSLIVVANIVGGPAMGWAAGRHPWHRSTTALAVVGAIVVVWTVTLAWPGQAPVWLLAVLAFVAGVGGPASMIAFDVGRTSNPATRLASASGIINQGGFVAALLVVLAVGWLLDWRTPGGGVDYPPSAFHWALTVQYLFWGLGAIQIWRYRRRVRRSAGRARIDAGSTVVEITRAA
ncbi:MFS transporter [Nocardioides sp. KR10-350]|uniref:MFS transporter n=1 Tax=Nocardioides cheoyonin TaxID=3156615 RepID=UPI0032B41F3F